SHPMLKELKLNFFTKSMCGSLALCAAVLPALVAPAAPQTKAIELIVPYAAGGPNDVIARLLAEKLGQALGRTMIVVNKVGAGSLVGTEAAARAAADGSTLLFVATSFVYNPALFPHARYDPLKSFAPISLVGASPLVLMTTPQSGYGSVADVMAAARAKPDT